MSALQSASCWILVAAIRSFAMRTSRSVRPTESQTSGSTTPAYRPRDSAPRPLNRGSMARRVASGSAAADRLMQWRSGTGRSWNAAEQLAQRAPPFSGRVPDERHLVQVDAHTVQVGRQRGGE